MPVSSRRSRHRLPAMRRPGLCFPVAAGTRTNLARARRARVDVLGLRRWRGDLEGRGMIGETPIEVIDRIIGDVRPAARPVQLPSVDVETSRRREVLPHRVVPARPLRLDEMVQPDTTNEYIIDRFLRPRVLGIIGAPAGIGKSQIRTEIGMLAAAGRGEFLDYYEIRGGPYTVLVIDEENGDAEEWRRDEVHLERLDLTRDGLPYYRISFAGVDLATQAWQSWLREQIEVLGVDLLILDAISAMYSVPERREELMPIYRFLRDLITSTGVTILLIHHLKKPAANEKGAERVLDDLRGGLWGQVAEVAAILSPLPERHVKWRTWKRVPPTELILEQTESGPLVFASHVELRRSKSDDRVLSYIDAGATSVDEIVASSGMKRSTVYTGLQALRNAGIVERGTPLRRKP